ncbi:MAG: hypothetical protein ACKVOK_01480 [Flavobacteriales bacterium]
MTIDYYLIAFLINQIPVFFYFWNFKVLKGAQKWFGLFLIWGATVDIKYYLPLSDEFHDNVYLVFVLTEVGFYLWFLGEMGKSHIPKKMIQLLLIGLPIFWYVTTFLLEDPHDNDIYTGLYDGVTAALLSSIAAFQIYKLTQSQSPLEKNPNFWFLSGIFFYFFCSVFIFSIMSKEVAEGAWMVHRVINAATMIIFAIGFHVAGKSKGGPRIA